MLILSILEAAAAMADQPLKQIAADTSNSLIFCGLRQKSWQEVDFELRQANKDTTETEQCVTEEIVELCVGTTDGKRGGR